MNEFDKDILGAAWGSHAGDPNWNPDADLNEDGEVALVDLAMLGQSWYKSSIHSNPMDIEMKPEERDWYWDLD